MCTIDGMTFRAPPCMCGIKMQIFFVLKSCDIQGVPGGKVNILGGHIIGHSKQKILYEHVSYSERFPRYMHLTV